MNNLVSAAQAESVSYPISLRDLLAKQKTQTDLSLRASLAAGSIKQKYEQIGGLSSPLGSSEAALYLTTDRLFKQNYVGGDISQKSSNLDGPNEPVAYKRYVMSLTFKGLHCVKETTWDQSSSSDEPYFILALATPNNPALSRAFKIPNDNTSDHFSEFDDDNHEAYIQSIWLDFIPEDALVTCTMFEQDFGDPQKTKQKVQGILNTAVTFLTLGASEIWPEFDKLTEKISEGLATVFGLQDDMYSSARFVMLKHELIDPAVLLEKYPKRSFRGMEYNHEVSATGGGSHYRLFFEMIAYEITPVTY